VITDRSTSTSQPILVIDDEPYILRALSFLLEREGYLVETACNGEDGLALLQRVNPPLVILDVMLPRLSGYEVCERLKQDPTLADTYVIMLSAKGQSIDRQRGLLGGADEYLTKPFSPQQLAQRIHTVLDTRARRDGVEPGEGDGGA
jgi:DNA-binding response OmpR family regulator